MVVIKNEDKLLIQAFIEREALDYTNKFDCVDLNDKPTAVIAFSDVLAIGAISAIKDRGYKVPGDFSVVGFDNLDIDNFLETKLSSISVDKKQIVTIALNLLMKRLQNNKRYHKKVYINANLIEREIVCKITNLK